MCLKKLTTNTFLLDHFEPRRAPDSDRLTNLQRAAIGANLAVLAGSQGYILTDVVSFIKAL